MFESNFYEISLYNCKNKMVLALSMLMFSVYNIRNKFNSLTLK